MAASCWLQVSYVDIELMAWFSVKGCHSQDWLDCAQTGQNSFGSEGPVAGNLRPLKPGLVLADDST